MTTSRLLLAVFFLTAGMGWTQTQPKDLPWVVAAFGDSDWGLRLPQLLVRGWELLPPHQLTDEEKAALQKSFLDETLSGFSAQSSRLILELDRKRLKGELPSTEPAATQKALADLEVKRSAAGTLPAAQPPATLDLRPVWAAGRENLPWLADSRPALLSKSKALYLITGSIRMVGTYLKVKIEFYSDIEKKVLSTWEGQFGPDEAPAKSLEAADQFRSVLLGRPWAGLNVTSAVPGAKIKLADQWHTLPWSSDDLSPGELKLAVQNPGRVGEVKSVTLVSGQRTSLALETLETSPDRIVLETEPAGVALYLDSRYLGPSPQTVDRPLATSRVRAQAEGWATTAWEIGPLTSSPSHKILLPPAPARPVPAAKDRFYTSLAVFSFSLTSSAFLGAWRDEQVTLTNAYATAGAVDGYYQSLSRYNTAAFGYGASIALTSAVFVWMMFELGDYLGAAQASLP